MAHQCPYCKVAAPDDAPVCPQCGAPQPVIPRAPGGPGNGWGRWIDPTEGAFAVMLPAGWAAQGGVFRGGPYGLPECRFEARGDRDGQARVLIGGQTWQFQDMGMPAAGMGGMLGGLMQMFGGGMAAMMGGGQALPWQDAATFTTSWLLPQIQQMRPDVSIVSIDPRPDVEAFNRQKLQMDASARGMGGYEVDATVVEAALAYSEQGTRFRERLRVQTTRLRAGAMSWMTGAMPMTMWFGEVAFTYRAPEPAFDEAEATLRAIAESIQRNPAWEAAQLNADNQRALASQQQNMARQRQISQTLSETSDIVSSGYWSRQQIHEQHAAGRQAMGAAGGQDWSQAWSNATLGWEDRVDENGNRYSIQAGHERVWRDNQGNIITGNSLTNPDPTWHELKKPGE